MISGGGRFDLRSKGHTQKFFRNRSPTWDFLSSGVREGLGTFREKWSR